MLRDETPSKYAQCLEIGELFDRSGDLTDIDSVGFIDFQVQSR
jgi:hypothetical protein